MSFSTTQVFVSGQEVHSVTGGFNSGDKISTHQQWTQEFNCPNEYTFSFADHPLFKVVVKPKPIVDTVVTDNGFSESLVHVYKGDNVRWTWTNCSWQHSINKVDYCLEHAGYVPVYTEGEGVGNPSRTGSHIETFSEPGVYYFRTQKFNNDDDDNNNIKNSPDVLQYDTCVIQVRKKKQELLIELKEDFTHAFYECQSGERVWVQWRSHLKTPNSQSVAIKQISSLKITNQEARNELVVANQNEPTTSGCLSHVFREAGVYEVFDQESTYKKCVVMVKPAKQQHEVRINKAAFLPGKIELKIMFQT